MVRIRENIENNAAGDERNRRHLEDHQNREIQILKDELSRKDEALVSQESRIKEIITQWEEETEVTSERSTYFRGRSYLKASYFAFIFVRETSVWYFGIICNLIPCSFPLIRPIITRLASRPSF